MTSLTNFFVLAPTYHPNPFLLSLIDYQATATLFFSLPLCRDLLSGIFIGYQDTWLIINSLLLIIIPGIHNLTCLMMTRSLVILIKPCSILLKIISSHTVTLHLFFHCTFVMISNSLYIKTYCLRGYFMLIIV